jgi:hypothetical protein
MPGAEPLNQEDLPHRAHRDARHENPEAIGGVTVQRLGHGRHHLHEGKRECLGKRGRENRPAEQREIPDEARRLPQAGSARWFCVRPKEEATIATVRAEVVC